MAKGNQDIVLRHLDTLFRVGTVAGLTDAQLLERFISRRDETSERAFAALVERHGPMVLHTCRAVLRDAHLAHDAFQATFLVLVRRAGSLGVRDSLGPWLHQVALRTASCSRASEARRRRHEGRAAALTPRSAGEGDRDGLGGVIHEEVDRLPARYRAAVVLCLLEGLTTEQAARHLGWPVGTVHSRLARGRERLRGRLVRRGWTPAAAVVVALLYERAGRTAVPSALKELTLRAAGRPAAGQALAVGAVSAAVASLAEGVLVAMLMSKVKTTAAGLMVMACVGAVAAAGLAGQGPEAGRRAVPPEERDGRVTVTSAAPDPADPGGLQGNRRILHTEMLVGSESVQLDTYATRLRRQLIENIDHPSEDRPLERARLREQLVDAEIERDRLQVLSGLLRAYTRRRAGRDKLLADFARGPAQRGPLDSSSTTRHLPSPSPSEGNLAPAPSLERRLDELESKLDRVLKTLGDGRPKTVN